MSQLPHGGIGEGMAAHLGKRPIQGIGDGLAVGGGESARFQGVMEDKPERPQHQEGEKNAEEDEKDLNKVHFDIELYRIYVKGYLEMARDVLTPAENASLPWGARLMTLECGMRFLADFLQGDVYFKTTYPEHNLVRARTQFRLVKEMEEQFDQMQEIVETF